jgi:hypothetical protein
MKRRPVWLPPLLAALAIATCVAVALSMDRAARGQQHAAPERYSCELTWQPEDCL